MNKLTTKEWEIAKHLCQYYWHMGVPAHQLRDRVLQEIGRMRCEARA